MTQEDVERRIWYTYDSKKLHDLCKELDVKENWCHGTKKGKYLNLPCSFDIETTSYTSDQGEKEAYMYIWMLCLNGITFIGRTWDEFIDACQTISDGFGLEGKRKLVCYVHNLAFEFQFFRKRLHWINVFASEDRKPIYALCDLNIEFRCSYMLSNYSLAKVADNLTKFKIKKLVGELDYRLIRTKDTVLTSEELDYCINDVLILCCYIQEKIDSGEPVSKIPLTNTGYVRRYCRQCCLDYGRRGGWYDRYIRTLTMSPTLYVLAKNCFMGGFTHASNYHSGKVYENVSSYDFISAYPARMCGSREFCCEVPHPVIIHSDQELETYLKYKACFFTIEFVGLRERDGMRYEHYIPESKCFEKLDYRCDNGRIIQADLLTISITNIDFEIIRAFYEWDDYHIIEFYVSEKSYLPKQLIKAVLSLYKTKTELKGIAGKEAELLHSKGMLNASYGMMVTDIVRDLHSYDEDWKIEVKDIDKQLEMYNESRNRFSYYLWGIQITALCRFELFKSIRELKYDYIYADTDSVKFINGEKHFKWFENYNKENRANMFKMCDFYHLDHSLVEPLNIKGEKKMLGEFEREKDYQIFKTLGAKRYMTMQDDRISITVSGLNKKVTVPYLIEQARRKGCSPFDLFDDELYIPKGQTGKLIHTYIDEPVSRTLTDCQGHVTDCSELSCVHLEEADYTLSMTQQYLNYIKERKYDYEIL